MDKYVQEDNLTALYGLYNKKYHIFQAPPKLHLFVTHYNSFSYLRKCINSIFTQKVSVPFDVTLIDDCSDLIDSDIEQLENWGREEPERLRIQKNQTRQSKGINLFTCLNITPCDDEDIICVLDGDDWFADENSLEKVVKAYQETGCWVTYGSYKHSNRTLGCCARPLTSQHYESEKKGRGFREAPWVFSHLFTSKAFLWKKLSKDILIFNDHIATMAPDVIFNIPIAEMAGTKRIHFISDVLVIYNNENSISECRVDKGKQETTDLMNRQRVAFHVLKDKPEKEFTILIPCKGRQNLLEITLKVFKKSLENKNYSIILIEQDVTPNLKDLALNNGIGWIYIPMDTAFGPAHPLGQFNKSCCFDIGFIYGPKAKYYLCHDSDLLIPENFWTLLKENMDRGKFQALQTYSDRFVWQTTKEISEKIQDNISWYYNSFSINEHCTPNRAGAKGGSIVVSHDLYLKSGGHDPQLFWGYAPEDQMFWMKLETLTTIGYGELPRIPLTHLWHLPAASLNPLLSAMDSLFYSIKMQDFEFKREYIYKKALHFSNFYLNINEER